MFYMYLYGMIFFDLCSSNSVCFFVGKSQDSAKCSALPIRDVAMMAKKYKTQASKTKLIWGLWVESCEFHCAFKKDVMLASYLC